MIRLVTKASKNGSLPGFSTQGSGTAKSTGSLTPLSLRAGIVRNPYGRGSHLPGYSPHCEMDPVLLIKTATSATFVVTIQGSSCLYAGPKYNTPPWKQGNDCIIATKRPAQAEPGRACCVCCYFFSTARISTIRMPCEYQITIRCSATG